MVKSQFDNTYDTNKRQKKIVCVKNKKKHGLYV